MELKIYILSFILTIFCFLWFLVDLFSDSATLLIIRLAESDKFLREHVYSLHEGCPRILFFATLLMGVAWKFGLHVINVTMFL